jgi:uncharacterized membrane protein YtjA (UPF0391 family)
MGDFALIEMAARLYRPPTKMASLLGLGILFLVIAFIAYIFGARGIAGFSMEIAKIIIVVFVILFIISLIF